VGSTPALFRQSPTGRDKRALLDHNDRIAGLDLPDDRRAWVAFADAGKDRGRGGGFAGDQQTARGLRVREQEAAPVFEALGQDDGLAVIPRVTGSDRCVPIRAFRLR